MYVSSISLSPTVRDILYLTADMTCRPKYRRSVVLLPIRIYFVLQKYERVSQLQYARTSSTPSSHHGWTMGMLSCTSSCTSVRRPKSSYRSDGAGRPAKHSGRIATTPLAARKVSHRVQDTRYCASRLTRSDADVHRLSHHAVRAEARPAICRPRVASGSPVQPRTLWTPLILPCRTNSVERII